MMAQQEKADFVIIGGGIAGASAGFALSQRGKVVILEKEKLPGYHSTSRSSAIFQKSYNHADPLLNRLVMASAGFFHRPPDGFTRRPLLKPRPLIYIAPREGRAVLDRLHQKLAAIDIEAAYISAAEARQMLPILAPAFQDNVLREQGAADMDVDGLHAGYLRAVRAQGGYMIPDSPVVGLTRKGNLWHVETPRACYQTPIVLNAAGAWVDQVAALAGIRPIGIQPLRRTIIMVALPPAAGLGAVVPDDWPLVMNPAAGYYFKPDSGKILMTPGDSQLVPPSDVQPEEMDIAYGAHYLEQATNLKFDRIDRRWAGLRNHVADGHPVVGFDPEAEGFFWLAGQGGFGIKTAPALSRIAEALVLGRDLPPDISALGIKQAQIDVCRLKHPEPLFCKL